MPSSEGSEALLLTPWLRYSKLEDKYLAAKGAYMKKALTRPADITLDIVWDGDGENTNAALTVFRHFDSATVLKGFVGDVPKTAWLIEYPLLERIHYLLVAGFDVYGNAGHQLNSRLYMDFLRMEGEFNFLTLLPKDVRVPERDFWYRNARQGVKEYIYGARISFDVDSGIPFESDDPKAELFDLLRRHLGPALDESRDIDRGADAFVTEELGRLAAVQGQEPRLAAGIRFSDHYRYARWSGCAIHAASQYRPQQRIPRVCRSAGASAGRGYLDGSGRIGRGLPQRLLSRRSKAVCRIW